jgi:DNA-binding HxlR family transcriptional regulator
MSETFSPRVREDRVLLDLIGDKWTVLVLGSLCDNGGRRRFNAIRRDVPGISQRSLTNCLRRLERNGLIKRFIIADGPLGVEYTFTDLGLTLDEPVGSLLEWTAAHANQVRTAQEAFDKKPGVVGIQPPRHRRHT